MDIGNLLAALEINNTKGEETTAETNTRGYFHSVSEEEIAAVEVNNSAAAPLTSPRKTFDIYRFIDNLSEESIRTNSLNHYNQTNINAYDLTTNCILSVVYKLRNQPINQEDYRDTYLPIKLKGMLGNTIHKFIQENYPDFTENEVSLRVPELSVSVRVDSLIEDHTLVEIKSLPFVEYDKIVRSRKPRDEDFYQAIFYRYLLQNHLESAKSQDNTRTPPPKLNKYNIDTVQIIYVANDLLTSDANSIPDVLKMVQAIKKLLNSRHNQFYFMTTITFDLKTINIEPYETYLVQKLCSILEHLKNNTLPSKNDPFCDTKKCYFCAYHKTCQN